MTLILDLLTLGLLITFLVVGTPALIRWYTTRLQRARAHIQIRENLQAHLNRRAYPDVTPRKLTDEEKAKLTAWREERGIQETNRGIRDNALAPYKQEESA